MNRRLMQVLSVFALSAGLAGRAEADLTISATEVGGDVIIAGSGSLNLAGLTFVTSDFGSGSIQANLGFVSVGPLLPSFSGQDVYSGITGPASFGTGALANADAASNSPINFGVIGSDGILLVAGGYSSGATLSPISNTYDGATFASLGLTPGTYTYTLPSDTVTVEIGPVITATPEPGTMAMLASAVPIGVVAWMRRRKRA